MGLDVSHGCWSGPYSSFTRWRNMIAVAAGYVVWPVLVDRVPSPTVMLDWSKITEANLEGRWERAPGDVLIYLLAHRDDAGILPADVCAPLANRLEVLVEDQHVVERTLHWAKSTNFGYGEQLGPAAVEGLEDFFKRKTRTFVNGLRRAAEARDQVSFH